MRKRPATAIGGLALIAAFTPAVIGRDDLVSAAAEGLFLLLAAIGLNLAVGYAGQPSLGQGAFVAIGAYTAARLVAREGWDPATAVLVAVGFGTIAGAILARGVARLRPPFVALATWLAAWIAAFAIAAFPRLTGGSQGLPVPRVRLDLRALGAGVTLGPPAFFEIALVLALGALALSAAIVRRYGPALAATRADPAAARAAGVPVERLRARALVLSATIGSLAGALIALNAGVADPTAYGPLLSVKLFIVVLAGGAGRLLGPAAGLAVIVLISRAGTVMADAAGASAAGVEPIAAGLVLAVVLLFGGQGIVAAFGRRRDAPADGPAPSAPVPLRFDGAAVEASGVRVAFGGVHALDGVDLRVERGTCHVVIGPNGSGKTTCLRVLGGALRPDAGDATFDGELLTRGPAERARAGVVRTLQRLAVAPGLTALEHVASGLEPLRSVRPVAAVLGTPAGRREQTELAARARAALALAGLAHVADRPAETLSGAEQRLLQIARALAAGPRVLLIDEPSAGLDVAGEETLRALLARLRDAGLTVVLVEHNLRLVRTVGDRVSVLDAGRVVATGTVDEIAANHEVQALYLGTTIIPPDAVPAS